MFGFGFRTNKDKSSSEINNLDETDVTSSAGNGVIRISDFIGTLSNSDSRQYGINAVSGRGNVRVMRTDVMHKFIDSSNAVQKIFRDAIIGKCDGVFPVTNPIKDNIYYYPVDNKYYKCITSHNGAVIKPDVKFKEFSLTQMNDTKFRTINILGAAKGNGSVDERGVVNVTTTINWTDISGKPSSMKNPHTFVLQLNGKSQTAYDGSAAVNINITPQNIGAQPAGNYASGTHNHDSVYAKISHIHSEYQPKGSYASSSHTHDDRYAKIQHTHDYLPISGGKITGDIITTLNGGLKYVASDGTNKWLISNNNGTEIAIGYSSNNQNVILRTYNEIYAMNDKKVWHSGNFDPASKAPISHNHNGVYQPVGNYSVEGHRHDDLYQPKGSYASSSHNHDSVYAKLNHVHVVGNINMTGYTKGTTTGAIVVADTLGVAIGKLEKALDSKQPAGNYASSNHNHDTVYAPKSHNHNDLYNTKTEITNLLKGYSTTSHRHDDLYQPKGNYAPSSHNHTSGHITAMTGYVKATTASAITPSDSMNVAIGKLEKALDSKQASGSYAPSSHNHNDLYYGKGEIDSKLRGYSPTSHNHDDRYAAKNHIHNDLYYTKSEVNNSLAGKLDKTANAVSASKLATGRTIAISGAVSGSVVFDGSANATINTTLAGFDAGKITSGVISVDRLPKTALSEFVPVANKSARLKLTKSQVQNGDTVKETDTKRMFLVIDDTKLNSDAGYQEYTTVVDWASVTGKPSTFTPSGHNHTWEQITNRPTTMVNPHALTISLNGKAQTAYTGSGAVSFNITPASIGAQVAGSYANSNHNHDSVYSKLNHTHSYLALSGGNVTGTITSTQTNTSKAFIHQYNVKAPYYNEFSTSERSEYYPIIKQKYNVSGESGVWSVGTLINSNEFVIHHILSNGDGDSMAIYKFNKNGDIYTNGKRVWHSGNFDPESKAQLNHNHNSAYYTKDEMNTKLNGYSLTSHNHDSKYQLKGNYAEANHTHSYAGSSSPGGDANRALKLKDYNGSYNIHVGFGGDGLTTNNCQYMVGITKSGNEVYYKDISKDQARAFIGAAPASHTHDDRYYTEGEINSKLSGYSPSNHNHNGVYAPNDHTHDIVRGNYTSNGGQQPPSYIPSGRVRFNMMNTEVRGDRSYKDWILMDTYTGSDVPTVTAFGISKSSDLKAFIMSGSKGGSAWARSAEIWTTSNFNPSNYASSGHNHDDRYAKISHTHSEYQPKGSYAPSNHNHDDRYYTESEINSKLSNAYLMQGQYVNKTNFNQTLAMNRVFRLNDSSSYSGVPGGMEYGQVVVLSGGADTAVQMAFPYSRNRFYFRTTNFKSGTDVTRSWNEVWHDGNFNPNSKLNTSGGTINGSLTVTGQILSNVDVVVSSDVRYKTNVRVIDSPLDKISKIHGYYYDMMGVENEHQVGVLAQELREVLPEAVFEDTNDHLGVRYTNLIPLLIEGIKEIKTENDKLNDRVTKLESILMKGGML